MAKDKVAKKADKKVVPKKETKTIKKTVKKGDAPKRPLSAYMYFSQAKREETKAENPEASFGQLGQIMGAKWKNMTDDEKKPYAALALKDRARYDAQKAAKK